MLATSLGHLVQARSIISVAEERLLPKVAAPDNVVRQAWTHDSCKSRHATNLTDSAYHVNHRLVMRLTNSPHPRGDERRRNGGVSHRNIASAESNAFNRSDCGARERSPAALKVPSWLLITRWTQSS